MSSARARPTTVRPTTVRPTTVRPTTVRLPGAALGPESPLPSFEALRALPTMRVGAGASPEMAARVAHGRLGSPLPVRLQRDYGRELAPAELSAYVLDNGVVRATVLPSMGGRVWSLYDVARGRELLFVNPALQWAEFGLSGAWCAGGIEWNLGSTGHSTLTSRPVHVGVLRRAEGDVLRLWEWERTRDLVLQVDLWLPPGSDRLHASTRVLNPDPEEKPLYYWTNVAVPETAGTRVLARAQSAWRTDYAGVLQRVPVPHPDSVATDVSFPRSARAPADYFFEGSAETGRWIAAVERDGRGMAQTSTAGLRGRKLFHWGDGPGGRRWQQWLGGPGSTYAEIQAGWCDTQLEHDVLPGAASVAWTETFSGIDLVPAEVGGDHEAACAAAEAAVHRVRPAELEQAHARWLATVADAPPDEVLAYGSGWGHAELALRGAAGWPALPFPVVEDESRHALAWLAGGDVPSGELPVPPVSARWVERLHGSGRSDWWTCLATAVAAHLADDREAAGSAYHSSLSAAPTAWAHRGLAVLAAENGDVDRAREHYDLARAAAPGARGLATELVTVLLEAGRPGEALAGLDDLPAGQREHGRTRLLEARALTAAGRHDAAAALLEGLVVPDLAEGETMLSDLWRVVRPQAPLPAHLDFVMTESSTPEGDRGDRGRP